MTVLDKMKELCDAIIISDEFKELVRAETILEACGDDIGQAIHKS